MPRERGIMWEHFEHIKGAEGAAFCKVQKVFQNIKNSNRSGLLKHLKNIHPQIFKEVQKSKEQSKRAAEEMDDYDDDDNGLHQNVSKVPGSKKLRLNNPSSSKKQESQQVMR